jgi:hypothetical protein
MGTEDAGDTRTNAEIISEAQGWQVDGEAAAAALAAAGRFRDSKMPKCDGGCNFDTGPEETCSAHGRPVAEVWQIAGDAIERANAADRLVRALREEIHHAADNGHVLDRASQGVGPGELVPAVRVSSIEAAIEGFEATS